MSQLAQARLPRPHSSPSARKLLLVGQPNVGKSLLFTRLTNRYATVSNYPGTTVEITSALADLDGEMREVIDTPGTNTLAPQSFEERVTLDLILAASTNADVVQVGDIGNLRRTLLLSLQLAEHEVPFTLCLNMTDEPHAQAVDLDQLREILGVPVVATSALRRWNIEKLKRHAVRPTHPRLRVTYPAMVEKAIAEMQDGELTRADALAVMCSGGEPAITGAVVETRLRLVDEILALVTKSERVPRGRDTLGALCMHRIWGWPILALVLYAAWLFVGKLGAGTLVDFFEEIVFARFINPWATTAIDFVAPAGFIRDILVGEYGVITMALTYAIAIILPVVVTFFTLFGILEDSGYLPRLAVMLHRAFRKMGLNGKAVLPMVLGLGCDTMATLTTRILETKKERVIVTILLALGVPCSAQLGVIMAMLGPLSLAAGMIWLSVTVATIFLVGYLSSKVIRGDSGEFIIEIPPMRVPRLSNIAIKVLARTEWYLKEAVPLFILGTVILYVLHVTHLLSIIQRALAPLVVDGLGLPAQAANAFVIGFLRRDYGAAGLFAMQTAGGLTANQTVIALTVISLFIPCVANLLVMMRERGTRTALAVALFITVYAFGIGIVMNAAFRFFSVTLT